MTTYFISRHQGAKDWAELQNIKVDLVQSHLDIDQLKAGDVVIGTLPINMVAQLCVLGAKYYHLTLHLSEELRGKELTAQDMLDAGAKIEQYYSERVV